MPELLKMGFEAEQGMIRTSSWLFGIVSDLGPLVFSIDDQDDRVEIERQAGTRFGKMKQLLSELIVNHDYLTDRFGRESFEESPEGGLIGKSGKPKKIQKGSVVLKNLGLVDSPQTSNDDVDE